MALSNSGKLENGGKLEYSKEIVVIFTIFPALIKTEKKCNPNLRTPCITCTYLEVGAVLKHKSTTYKIFFLKIVALIRTCVTVVPHEVSENMQQTPNPLGKQK